MVLVTADTSNAFTPDGQDGLAGKQVQKNLASTVTSFSFSYASYDLYGGLSIQKNQYPTGTPTGTETYTASRRPTLLFRGITIPQSSVITDATLKLFIANGGGAVSTFTNKVYARKTADPQTLPTIATVGVDEGKQVFTRTTNAVAFGQFTMTGGQTLLTERNINMTATVQELVNAFDYNNDRMFFFIVPQPLPINTTTSFYTNSEQMTIQAYEGSTVGVDNPLLIINYTVGQTCVPLMDISNAGAWEDTTLGNGDTILFNELDEIDPDGETSAVRSVLLPTIGDTFEVKLQNCIDPIVATDHVIRINARGLGNRVKIQLFQGAGLIAESGEFILTGLFADYTYTLSGGEADSIGNYNDLRIRVVPSVVP